MLVGVLMVAALVGASQGGADPAKPNPKPATSASALSWVEAAVSWAEIVEQDPDPKVVTDADFLKRITETKLPWRVKDKATGIEMLLVPPGTCVMGMSPGDTEALAAKNFLPEKFSKSIDGQLKNNEIPAHEVTITKLFYLGRTEVTQEQWVEVMGENPSYFQKSTNAERERVIAKYIEEGLTKQEAQEKAGAESPNKLLTATNPVEQVSWDNCQKFRAKTGMKLPTEAQWEYACRAGLRQSRYGVLEEIAWFVGNSDLTTHPVAMKAPNALGFYDMLGNVNEWCQDWGEIDYYNSCADGVVDPTGPAQGECHLLRGGGWHDSSDYCRASMRGTYDSLVVAWRLQRTNKKRADFIKNGGEAAAFRDDPKVNPESFPFGFRVVRTIPPPMISSVSPAFCSTSGGVAITITGENLTGASSVTVGLIAATNVVVVDRTRITAVAPAGTAGKKLVEVTTPLGTATAGSMCEYFIAPTISSVWPEICSTSGGDAIKIWGKNLTGTTSVTVGGIAVESFRVENSMLVSAVAPAGTAGVKSVAVTTWGGTASTASLPSNSITYSVEKVDTEFDTTSIVDVFPSMWRSGKLLVRKGLEIKTKKPELPILTRLTTSPGNPVCEVLFGKDGVPVSCKILQSSGFADIDGPVLDALWRWRAKGSQLDKLAPGKALPFRLSFILN